MFLKPLKKNPSSFQQLTVADKFKLKSKLTTKKCSSLLVFDKILVADNFKLKSKLTTKKYSFLLVFDKILVAVNIATSVCLTTIPLLWCFILCIMNKYDDSRILADICCTFFPFFYAVGGKILINILINIYLHFPNILINIYLHFQICFHMVKI